MSALPSLLIISLLQGAAPAPSASDLAAGSLSYLFSKDCHDVRKDGDTDFMEWKALIYTRTGPIWGPKKCKASAPDIWTASEALGAGALWATSNQEEIEVTPKETLFNMAKTYPAFKKVFGWELINHGTIAPNAFIKYDAKKLKRMFDMMYLKPTDALGSYPAQEAYNRTFKRFIERFARDAAFLKTAVPKAKLAKMVKDYQATAKARGQGFSGGEYLREVAMQELPQDQEPESAREGKTLGIMLRRTADGTWPTVVALLKKVLADYDPELSKELAEKL